MKFVRALLVATALTSCAFPWAGDVKVIANEDLKADTISVAELKSIFFEEKRSLDDGTHAEPVLEKDGLVHEAFLRQYIGKSADDLQAFYLALVFTGRGSLPKQFGSDAEVIRYVARTAGAIGYVNSETIATGVKTLAVVGAENGLERRLLVHIEPEYPETLRHLSIGGTVRLRVTISSKGKVVNVELLGGNPILAEAATAAVKQWVYSSSHTKAVVEVTIPFDPRL
jgi:TonB family protein